MCYYTKKNKTNRTPYFTAILLFTLLLSIDITMFFYLIFHFLKGNEYYRQWDYKNNNFFFIGFLFFNFFYFFKRREIVLKKYDTLSLKRKSKGKIYFWAFIFLSIIIAFGLGAILSK